jgi:hypothetical protein
MHVCMYVCRLLHIGRIRMDVTTPGVTWDLDKTCRHPTLVCCAWAAGMFSRAGVPVGGQGDRFTSASGEDLGPGWSSLQGTLSGGAMKVMVCLTARPHACRKSHSKCTATWTSSMPKHQHAASPFSSGEACQQADSPRGMDCVVLPSQSICGSLSDGDRPPPGQEAACVDA